MRCCLCNQGNTVYFKGKKWGRALRRPLFKIVQHTIDMIIAKNRV